MIQDQTIIAIWGSGMVTIAVCVALFCGIDGAIFMSGLTAIGVICGYKLKAIKNSII